MINLSIIIPVYNTEAFLPNCLDSICSQLDLRTTDIEIIVVNDGSPDNSSVIIEDYRSRFPSIIKVINKPNGGLSDARNAAMDKAIGRYLWFVDSDDSIEQGAIQALLSVIKHTEVEYIYFNAYRVNLNGSIIGKFDHGCAATGQEPFEFTATNVQTYFNRHMVWMRLFKRDFVGFIRFPKGITHEDIHFDLQLLARKPRILALEGIFYRHFFDNPDSITNTMNPQKHRHVLWVYDDLAVKFANEADLQKYLEEYLEIAVSSLYSRANYILTTHLTCEEKRALFFAYSNTIKRLVSLSKVKDFDASFSNVPLLFIVKGLPSLAYKVSLLFMKQKNIYDKVTSSRYKLYKLLRNFTQ